MKRTILLLIGWWLTLALQAQPSDDWRETLRQWMTAEDIEEGYGEETLELLPRRLREVEARRTQLRSVTA